MSDKNITRLLIACLVMQGALALGMIYLSLKLTCSCL